ncbi:MAG: PEP-CTERM sorting domain-containing protein [Pirellulales bacterium]|nr:PEP-CTERM sorting domain-containing protein [Pirellulales bacterium]
MLLARNNTTDFTNDLSLITVPHKAAAGERAATAVPEPSTLGLLVLAGLCGGSFGFARRRRRC